jgi:glutamine synthetase
MFDRKDGTPKKPESIADVLKIIHDDEVKFVDLRFTNTQGKEQHVSVPVGVVNDNFFKEGKMFDGSSIAGWKCISESDMVLMPDPTTAVLDPFFDAQTLIIRCDVLDPITHKGYDRDPRSIAKRCVEYLKSTNIADAAYFGPEPEFFIFDDVRWDSGMSGSFYAIDSEEAKWNSGKIIEGGNIGHRPSIKGGYFPVPPVDSSQNIRSEMCMLMEKMGLHIEAHHHEVATSNQNEICARYNDLVQKADEMQLYKYVVHNVAHSYGKTATFMPKPLFGDNGSGMHCHQSLSKDGKNIFAGDQYAGLSETALYYIGGILHHARTLNAFTNPTTNSYKRLVPGFEAPVLLAYSARNRSAAIRIPYDSSPKGTRIEVRFPDPCANPYLAFSAMILAGLDGIQKKMHPGVAMDKDLYDLPPEEMNKIPTVCDSLSQALEYLNRNRGFLTQTGVFSDDFLNSYIKLKQDELTRFMMTPHPIEFDMYYSL